MDTYYNLGEEMYYQNGDNGWWPAINAIQYRMEINDLCWTRDRDGNYYIASGNTALNQNTLQQTS